MPSNPSVPYAVAVNGKKNYTCIKENVKAVFTDIIVALHDHDVSSLVSVVPGAYARKVCMKGGNDMKAILHLPYIL